MEILVFGADSLVGSHFVAQTAHAVTSSGRRDPRPDLPNVQRHLPSDLTDSSALPELLAASGAEAVVNFAAVTDVDGSEKERAAPATPPSGSAYQVNALAAGALAEACAAAQLPLFHLSTDFVFDGTAGPYAESELPSELSSSVSWYGWTKGDGERRVRASGVDGAILRIAYPYRAKFDRKSDFARALLARRRAGSLPPMFADQQFSPTWIPDVSRALEHLLIGRPNGTYHVASPETTSPYEFARALFGEVERGPPQLAQGSMEEFLRRPGTTPRPRRGGLKVERLPVEGVQPLGWREGVKALAAELTAA